MSDDKDSKTEEPTAKRQGEARNKGNVPNSTEVKNFGVIVGLFLLIVLFLPWIAGTLMERMGEFLRSVHDVSMTAESLMTFFGVIAVDLFLLLLLPILMFIAITIVANVSQFGFLFTTYPLKPKLSKLDVINAAKQKLSFQSVVEFIKSVLKFIVITAVAALILLPESNRFTQFSEYHPEVFLYELWIIIIKLLLAFLFVIAIIAIIDLIYTRHKHHESLKMTKQEVKDERKNAEGNPEVKRRIARLRVQRFRERMMKNVPRADVVVTNPTHYAVALEYKAGQNTAPKVIAKGQDFIALKIREVAEEYDVPIVENPAVARALYAACELNDEIPPEQYKAVAEIISFVYRVQGRKAS